MLLHYVTAGKPRNPPLVLIHGLFGNGNNMMKLARKLEPNHHVILPDQRNHGKSPWHDHMNYPAMADDVAAMLNAMHIDSAVVAGHSMGGKTAMKFALRYPHRVSKLVVLDIAPAKYPHHVNLALLKKMQSLDLERVTSLQQAQEELPVTDQAVKLFLLQNLVRDQGKLRWRLNLEAIKDGLKTISSFPSHSRSTDKPALFVHGTKSDYFLPRHLDTVRGLFSNCYIEPIAGADHWLHAEQAEATAQAMEKFINS